MKKQLYLYFIIIPISIFSQQTRIDSLSILIEKSENNTGKAKLLIKRSKAYPPIKTTEPFNDAILALELSKKDNDLKTQIDAYNQLSGISTRKDDYQKAIDFDLLALSLSEKENYFLGIVNSYKNISRNQKFLGKIREAVANAEKAKEVAVANNITQEYASLNNNLGVAYRNNNQFQESITVFNEGISQTKNKKLLALLHMNKANTFTEIMRLDEAIDSHLLSLKINEELKDEKGKQQVYNNLGALFKKAKQYDKAISYYQKSLKIAQQNKIESAVAISYDNIATVYDLTKKNDSIIWFRKNAIAIYERLNDEKNSARSYHNLGNYFLLHNQLIDAERNLNIALQKRIKMNVPNDIASTKTMLGLLYDKQKQFEKAEFCLLQAKELLKDVSNDKKEDLLKALSDHYKLKGDLEKALIIKEAQLQLKDSLLHHTEIINVVNKENNYVVEHQKNEIKKLASIENKFNNNKILFGVLIILVFLLALYSFIRWKKSDFYKNKIQFEKQKIEIEKLVTEKIHQETLEELSTVRKLVIKDFIVLKNNNKIYLKELIYIKSDDHYLEVYSKDKKEFLRGSISEISAQLPPNFQQTHRSFIVNKNFIQSLSTSEIVLKGNIIIPLTRKFKGFF
ncbi:MAG: tetratricopeptide repeat protein [Flavobacterium sp.]|nr:tetratricopeptide repeat protein [Flavobacterium sp.]